MKLQFSDKTRNLTFLCLTGIIIVCLFVVNNIGNKQNKVFAEESNQFKYALHLLSQNKVTEAEPLLKDLADKHPDNYEVIWNYGIVQLQLKNFEQARALFQQAQDENVTLVKNSAFLAHYGEVLYNLGDLEKARVYLEESLKFNPNEQVLNSVNNLLETIKNKDQQ
ncbi:tetratricopeptide repeat protein [Schinkia azotoformans]|uniref:Tetratricopeptide repeat-containing protein n=1 Tax=Schinkia azotoformans LMG 9581 TaxID=1131731 RepID=K6D3F7_SCHAZ|nr:tetratricopeptide repeat protein [Schinkia azotoformans]EKN62799.1 Tetratricopeptide repeat-containing protein [Schinkia azotoformans LMG 9581]MEC1639174.1 tetratricopeptide repeat protein [Schinkia azotoformans]MEC1945762.1 tetratricopeptide repeat protein [Schinkia azotoformans]